MSADTLSPDGLRIEELAEPPGLGGLYARGLGRTARLRIAGAAPEHLPDVAYRVRALGVDAARLDDYQHLVGEPAADELPAGFVHTLAFPLAMALMVRPDFPLPLLGMVHLANEARVLRPVTVSDQLEVTAWARNLRPHRRGVQVDLVAQVRANGGLAWQGVSTYLSKQATPAPGTADGTVPSGPPGRTDDPEVPTAVWRLGADVGRRYAAVSGDRNPIHLSALSARALGFPRAIAHGMYVAARALAAVGARRTDTYDWTVEFAKPVLLPSTVDVRVHDADGAFDYRGWDPRSGRAHFSGAVTPR